MEEIQELGKTLSSLEHEKIGIFCFTLIILFSLIWWNDYSISLILFCISMILHFLFISFYFYKIQYTDKEGKIITNSEYQLPRKNEKIHQPLKLIKYLSLILIIFSLLSFIFNFSTKF